MTLQVKLAAPDVEPLYDPCPTQEKTSVVRLLESAKDTHQLSAWLCTNLPGGEDF
jgi:hypothetical protein